MPGIASSTPGEATAFSYGKGTVGKTTALQSSIPAFQGEWQDGPDIAGAERQG